MQSFLIFAWVIVSGGGGVVKTDIAAMAASPVEEVEFASRRSKLLEFSSFLSSK